MIELRHAGIYVMDLEKMEAFYEAVLKMKPIFQGTVQKDELIDDLLGVKDAGVKIAKLITESGQEKKTGDMLELVQVLIPEKTEGNLPSDRPVYGIGMNHIAFGVDDLEDCVRLAKENGGKLQTAVHQMENGRKCAFLTDPEGNWIELIQ